jgi:hypothetical protein
MSRRSSLLIVVVVACGSAERHDATTPDEPAPGCPSSAAPEKCRDLAAAAASSGNGQLAWAYTVLECESPNAAQCTSMWQTYVKQAPTQTDALNVLHVACDHAPDACEKLASWHAERGHTLAAAAYRKRVEAARQPAAPGSGAQPPRTTNAVALATDLAAVMHLSGTPRTDAIAQMVGHQLHAAPIAKATKPEPKALPMHAAELAITSDGCAKTALLDRHQESLDKCISEVRPLHDDEISIRNRCGAPITIAYAGARGDRSTVGNHFRLERYEARAIGATHRDIGPLTYAVCADGCTATGMDSAAWNGQDALYNCNKGGP